MNSYKNLLGRSFNVLQCPKRFNVRRKFPINREEASELPTFQYPTAEHDDRRVYACGLSETGSLGLQLEEISRRAKEKNDKIKRSIKGPVRLGFAETHKVTDITCGYGFTLFAVKSKDKMKVYGTGINSDSQVGYQAPRRMNPLQMVLSPAPISLPLLKPETTKVISVAAGRAHSVVVTDNEGCYTLGNNAYGQCGRKVYPNESYQNSMIIHKIASADGEDIVAAECGQDHSMFITESGKVYACGWGADGQLGRGNFSTEHELKQAKGDIEGETIVKLSCSSDCILALNDKGEVFGWGNSEYGQLNSATTNDTQQLNTPRAVNVCKSLGKIKDIGSGGSFCIVLTENGEVYTWGYGLLGVGPRVEESLTPVNIPSVLFGRNEFNPKSVVTNVFCGLSHFAAITDTGDLYTWGKNKDGCLGLGSEADHFFPLKVAVGARAVKVACGVDHTVIMCKPFV